MNVPTPAPVPVTTPLPDKGSDSQVSFPWLNFFQQLQAKIVELSIISVPGPYANDAAAATAGVAIGDAYFKPGGGLSVRLV